MWYANWEDFKEKLDKTVEAAPRLGWLNYMMKRTDFSAVNKLCLLTDESERACFEALSQNSEPAILDLAKFCLLNAIKLDPVYLQNHDGPRIGRELIVFRLLTQLANPAFYSVVIDPDKDKWRQAIRNFLSSCRRDLSPTLLVLWIDASILSFNSDMFFNFGSFHEVHKERSKEIKERLLHHMSSTVGPKLKLRFRDFFLPGTEAYDSSVRRRCANDLLKFLAIEGKLDSLVDLHPQPAGK